MARGAGGRRSGEISIQKSPRDTFDPCPSSADAAVAAPSERRGRGEVERVKKRILLPEKTSVKEGKKERKRERWMNDDTNVQRTVFFAAAQKPGERASEKEGGRNLPFQRRTRPPHSLHS